MADDINVEPRRRWSGVALHMRRLNSGGSSPVKLQSNSLLTTPTTERGSGGFVSAGSCAGSASEGGMATVLRHCFEQLRLLRTPPPAARVGRQSRLHRRHGGGGRSNMHAQPGRFSVASPWAAVAPPRLYFPLCFDRGIRLPSGLQTVPCVFFLFVRWVLVGGGLFADAPSLAASTLPSEVPVDTDGGTLLGYTRPSLLA